MRNLRKAFAHIHLDVPDTIISEIAKNPVNEAKVADFISAFYIKFDEWLKKENLKEIALIKCMPFRMEEYETEYLCPLLKLQQFAQDKLRFFISALYVHGSISTLDYVQGWSDLDTFVIINSETAKDGHKLCELRQQIYDSQRFFHSFDSLQHHGHIIVTEIDLNFYPTFLLPPIVLKHSKPLIGSDKIVLNLREDRYERIKVLYKLCSALMSFTTDKCADIYFRKIFYHLILLLPTIFLQALSIYTYKRESFHKARPYFSKNAWQIIEEASKIRNSWNIDYGLTKIFEVINWNPALGQYIFRMLLRFRSSEVSENCLKYLISGARKLVEEALRNIEALEGRQT